ncbi:MAG: hypothetical protein PHS78_09065 [Aliarcobacter skirrowii]|uniref:hypothetical protein n=1 Tax=Aliarcobacter skirrowii TaxID=28200 RepID=UPI00242AD4FF|nr:hypothetical protein [Aliarcobacter skirrowii]MDD2509168.1 hypothetical protein [Aliarcobacter skirrowii]MDD3496539.1 hypothetical protein [Aliarcobacter skirrowii]
MTSPIQPNKTYGVLHTESFFSFLGFAKKVGSDEIQKIDVFLDDKLIDTIEANEFIQKIDDMYDVESKAFTYNLPTQYIGKKAIISFKNHDSGEELLNSPYTLIDKNHEKFNEAKFLHSLSEPLSEELKNMYKPNSIGFLATKENMEDEDFMNYIKELMVRFPEVEFKGFCFDFVDKIKIHQFFNSCKKLTLSNLTSVDDLKYISIFIENQAFKNNTLNSYIGLEIVKKLSIFTIIYGVSQKTKYISDVMNNYSIVSENKDLFVDKKNQSSNYKNGLEVLIHSLFDDLKFYDEQKSLYELWYFDAVKYAITSKNFRAKYTLLHKIRNQKK